MRTNRLRGACAAVLVIAGTALAQSPDITSFGNGQLIWTNSNSNLFYRIEWASVLTAPDAWHSNYVSLTDIRASNPSVTSSVPMFYRICGSSNRLVYASPATKTGAGDLPTYTEMAGEDGHASMRQGVAWPNPRFTVQADTNCVLDNLTGLVWARNANMGGMKTWSAALAYCEGLTYGGTNDWRLPNVQELQNLLDYGRHTPALCNTAGTGQWTENDPFSGVQSARHWTSTTVAYDTTAAWTVHVTDGDVDAISKATTTYYVWPVRGGQ